ncbi:MAG: SAP domain-containing protein [Methanobrevibacter sp.]|uniref:SAP domain-containing protein n=1 Tax=Methanobrevibacter sp. TaxID=66852 RepID=UPI001B084AA9|nr:SAP domain-containing protein [Methanobrevibacter sp.]MBO5151839.1 SAP domain-containing protein [Methanobrevibacter sp.]
MSNKDLLTKDLTPEEFGQYYFLKEELKEFCRSEGLKVSGNKQDLEKRIIHYLSTGKPLEELVVKQKSDNIIHEIKLDSKLGDNFKCSEDKREFLKNILEKVLNSRSNFKNG